MNHSAYPAGAVAAQLELSADQSRVAVLAGGQHILGLGIRNLGGATIQVDIGARGLPAGWLSINPSSLVLGPGQSAAIGCSLIPPPSAPAADYLISFTAYDRNNPATAARLDLPMEIGAPGEPMIDHPTTPRQAQAKAEPAAGSREGGQVRSSSMLPWLLVWGGIIALALCAAVVWAGPRVAKQFGRGATPTQMAVFLMPTTSTPLVPTEQPAPGSATGLPPTPGQGSQVLDPCSPLIITSDEAQTILGVPVTPPQGVTGGCAFNDAGSRAYAVSAAVGQNDQAVNVMMGQAMLLNLAGVQFDAAETDRLKRLANPATNKDYFSELVAKSQGAPSIKARLLDGVADGAYWAWLSGGSRPEGAIVAWSGGTLANVNVVVPAWRQEQEILGMTSALALKMLHRLPPSFNVGQPQAANVVPTVTPQAAASTESSPPTLTTTSTATATGGAPVPLAATVARTLAPPVAPGVYATGLRTVPPQPQNGQGVIFFVTFLNTTGSEQYFKWCVESFRPDGKSHGITACRPARTIAAGKAELSTTDPYVGQKFGPCLPLRARVIWENDQKQRIPFTMPDGSELWLSYQFCPA